jgi:hypothetical protein
LRDLIELVLSRTGGHVNSTLELLEALPTDAAVTDVEATIQRLAALHTDLTRRTIQHARTLHRLGGHILQVIAEGKRPYQETPDARSKEIGAAVSALHTAGIIRRQDALRQKNSGHHRPARSLETLVVVLTTVAQFAHHAPTRGRTPRANHDCAPHPHARMRPQKNPPVPHSPIHKHLPLGEHRARRLL